ncbi:MAG: CehA/McbA family metallohydrolase [Gemmatimonadetes bacterium]|nr:CehA/McbA family metallohydrolase [Gemmatimonadota bacterium]
MLRISEAAGQQAVSDLEPQPFLAHVARVEEALEFIGSGLQPEDRRRLAALRERAPSTAVVTEIQRILDPYVLAFVEINPEARVRATRGPAEAELVQNGWKNVLVKIQNRGAVRATFEVTSPNAAPLLHPWHWTDPNHRALPGNRLTPGDVARRFAEVAVYRHPPMLPNLSGEPVEYSIVQLYSKDAGSREIRLEFAVGQGTRDLAYRGVLDVLFQSRRAVPVSLRVKDDDGSPTTASFIISDGVQRVPIRYTGPDRNLPVDPRIRLAQADMTGGVDETDGRPKRLVGLYPLPSRRLAMTDEYPDFYFQPQIYRGDGEHVLLAPGTYEVEYTRGPEYLTQTRRITVPHGAETHEEVFQLRRWTDLSALGWYSADHHVHAAGCSHYESPEEGVRPEHMWRQIVGEDLDLASVLTWGPGWYHQKQFFTGRTHPLSTSSTVMRYDVEVSGFPSSHAGHLVLLGLQEDDYPGTSQIEEWPSWTIPVLEWAKKQGAVTGYAHSGWGLEPTSPTSALPNYVLPKMDGIGANEFVVAVTRNLVDFYSAGDTPPLWELNMWYHTLNAGFRTRLMGETDFPCIFDERIGLSRTYARVDGGLSFEAFLAQSIAGRSYVSDGRSHAIDFRANGVELGTGNGELRLSGAAEVTFTARVSALLPPEQDSVAAAGRDAGERPYWALVRSRIGRTRRVPVELVINGHPVARREIEADGSWQDVTFTHRVDRSSWAALRVHPSSHTNPIFILVDRQPVRASRRSAEWLRSSVDQAWQMKAPRIRDAERPAAAAAYEQARQVYDRIIAESPVE